MFEPQNASFSGEFTATMHDPSGHVPEITIIRRSDPWRVKAKWAVEGSGVSGLASTATWILTVLVESLGKGFEDQVAQKTVVVGAAASSHKYEEWIDINAASTFKDGANNEVFTEGPYKVTVTLTLKNGTAPVGIAGYHEFPAVVQFYDA